ncbi:MAG: hypothetical protein LH615_04315 [Ferruginibacter sp.]|nr:hypothetical protein [Ferruginibacter sp.]
MTDVTGKNYTGTITAVQDNKYFVKYDGVNFSAWLTPNQFSVASAATTANTTQAGKRAVSRFDVKMTAAQEAAIPDVSGGLPALAGTTWAVISIYEKGTVPKTQFRPANFLFCKNGKWEHQTGSLYMMGTYKVIGATLFTKDEGAGSKPEEWKLRWDGSVKEMEMEQGNLIFVLRYQGKAQC